MSETYDSVWDALEDSPEMAEDMKLRSRLMMEIQEIIRHRQWAPAEAARQFGMTQPHLKDLLEGDIEKFTLDALVIAAVRAGLSVDIRVRDAA
jgi:predicted XRE-type DNA-binding protein